MTEDVFGQPAQEADGIKRDRYGRYMLPDPEGKSNGRRIPWTRATTVAKTLSDTYALSRWGERQVVKGIGVRADLHALAASTPVSDTERLDSIAKQAKDAALSQQGANLGSALHSFTESMDRGLDPYVPDQWKPDVDAYQRSMKAWELTVVPSMIERVVVLPELRIAGTLDRIVRYAQRPGEMFIGDLKTAKRVDYSQGEIAIQLALYANAPLMWNPETDQYEDMPPIAKDIAWVMHLPVGVHECDILQSKIDEGWEAVQHALFAREWRSRRNLLYRPSRFPAPVSDVIEGEVVSETVSVSPRTTEVATIGVDRKRGTKALDELKAMRAKVYPSVAHCATCDADAHRCPGCGDAVRHEDAVCYRCELETATTRQTLSQVWERASGRGEWTRELETIGKRRQAELTSR